MMRLHLFEAMEREIDFQKEYVKLEEMCAEKYCGYQPNVYSINTWIDNNFRRWKRRENFTSFSELRKHLGFSLEHDTMGSLIDYPNVNMDRYFLFGEMLFNLIMGLKRYAVDYLGEIIGVVLDTIIVTVEKAGFECKNVEDEWVIVEKNAAAIEVAEKIPELRDVIIEYNHYLLNGDIRRKKELLKQISDAVEPLRKKLTGLSKRQTDDYFYLINNMDIRHNNCNSGDSLRYNPVFAKLSPTEKEEWYDLIYEQSLALYILLEQEERNKKIEAFKKL